MALILSIETSTSVCSIALHNQGNLLGYQSLFVARSHAESLLAMIDHLLDLTHYSPKDLQAVALSEGPGSYTGLRIGTATATGLCYALNIPFIAINTLESMVLAVKPFNITHALCCPMIDARRMEVYCLITDAIGNILEEAHPHIVTENSFEIWLRENKVLFFGDGAGKCKPILSEHQNAIFIDGIYPAAKEIGTLAYTHFQQQKFIDIAHFSPRYLKPFQSNLKPVG
ncbi:MAG: tRNA (adenosine(37)-N6)-threonylcarbamoyltransferase complex dimerization subunit type 1 TsaB [Candidatus Amoebophilus sp. 36-38]|nr:MAG: tRNA (adenosine(37)-N6)-threonylcarbamoyltransferase complex dimerization subunit type 1 TsaB [Candidatus Amoebophilus sp. 36-38]